MSVLDAPLSPVDARALIRDILINGSTTFTGHALKELRKDGMTTVDSTNVLRGGVVEPAEWENGAWRYRVRTGRMCVVVEFCSEDELVVVTAWRLTS